MAKRCLNLFIISNFYIDFSDNKSLIIFLEDTLDIVKINKAASSLL